MAKIVIKLDFKKALILFLLLVVFILLVVVVCLLKERKRSGQGSIDKSAQPSVVAEIPEDKNATKPKESPQQKKNTFIGFYTHYDKMDWGDIPVTCDALTVTGGDQQLIFEYKKMVEEGNGINYIDCQDRLVANLDLDYNVDAVTRKIITSSTPGRPIEVGLQERNLEVGGVPACFSFFQILWAKSY